MKGRQLPASAPCMDEAEGEGALGSWENRLNGGFLLSTALGLHAHTLKAFHTLYI